MKRICRSILFVSILLCFINPLYSNWKSFDVTFKMDPTFKKGPRMEWKRKKLEYYKEGKGVIMLPADLKENETIRGVMKKTKGELEQFALKNRFALYSGDADKPYGGPQKTFLEAAAKVTNHLEIAHAGAVLWGTSNGGRFAANFAHFWPERTLAVILDHSFCNGPIKSVDKYSYGNLPISPGVPYFFNASKKDLYQNFDRRTRQYNWCVEAFNTYSQPCTAVVSYESVGHSNPGIRSLQVVWLEEVLAMRVPAFIDPKGKPYKLKRVDPKKEGGHVSAVIETFEGRSIQTKVIAAPIGKIKKPSYWVPGPRSAKLMLDWVRKNDGTVLSDQSTAINKPLNIMNSDRKLKSITSYLSKSKLRSAMKAIDDLNSKIEAGKESDVYLAPLKSYKALINEWLSDHLKELETLKGFGDLVYFSNLLKSNEKSFKGLQEYDKFNEQYKVFLKEGTSKDNIIVGKKFYSIIKKMGGKRSKSTIKSLEKFSNEYSETPYGKFATLIMIDLSKDSNAPIDLSFIRRS
jgi:pimeloyl-ACP methyl ester carboxylesterase